MNLIKSEMQKTFREALRYYADYVVGIITDFLLLLIICRKDGGQTDKVLGYVLWILVNGVMDEASVCISTEKQLGTLQNLMIKPYSIISIITVKTFVWFIISIVRAVILLFAATVIFELENVFLPGYLWVAALVCFGTMGITYLLASLTLMFTKVASFINIIGYLLLFLSGSVSRVPEKLMYTNPLSFGARCMQLVLEESVTFADFTMLLAISAVWFLAGYVFFKVTFARAKQFKWSY